MTVVVIEVEIKLCIPRDSKSPAQITSNCPESKNKVLQVSLTITAHGQQTSITVSNDDLQDHQGGLWGFVSFLSRNSWIDAMDKSC